MNSQSDNTSKDQPVDEPFQFINNGDVEDKEWAAHIRLLNDYPADMQLRNIIQYARSGPFYPADMHVDLIEQFIQAECNRARKVTGETSDGYHTFNELYDYRRAYNAALFNEWAAQGKYDVHKSLRHSDGELCFGGGWFVVVAELPTGQITNHYKDKYYDEFQFIERERANPYDGHTPQEALERLQQLLKGEE